MDSSCSGWVKVTKSQWDQLNETIGFCVWWFCVGRGLSFAENKISHLRLQRNGDSNWLGFVVGPVEWCCCSYGLQKFLDAWPTVGNLGTKLCGSPLMGSTSLIGLNSSTSAHFTTYFHSPILKIKQTFNSGWSLTFDVSLISHSTLLVVYFPVAIGVKAVLITTFLKDCKSHNLTILLASSSPFVTLSRMAVWIVFVVLLWWCLIVMWLQGWAVVQHWGWCLGYCYHE